MDDDNVVRFPDGEPLKGWRPALTSAPRRRARVRWARVLKWAVLGAICAAAGWAIGSYILHLAGAT